ncbi:class III signal peptide-containing protein [Candidatus Micrarchaeota archaeon]|nr:class III signal peptide-containing protein [Candidatus Micrarchaeota archaeon]
MRLRRGQGTFEYVLLLGGVLLIVVLAIVVLQQTAQESFRDAGSKQCAARLLTDLECHDADGSWNACEDVDASRYAGCVFGSETFTAVSPRAGCEALDDPLTERYCGKPPVS